MEPMEPVRNYDYHYYLLELIDLGKQIDGPAKYTIEYNSKVYQAWSHQPFTFLHAMVLRRRKELSQKQNQLL